MTVKLPPAGIASVQCSPPDTHHTCNHASTSTPSHAAPVDAPHDPTPDPQQQPSVPGTPAASQRWYTSTPAPGWLGKWSDEAALQAALAEWSEKCDVLRAEATSAAEALRDEVARWLEPIEVHEL